MKDKKRFYAIYNGAGGKTGVIHKTWTEAQRWCQGTKGCRFKAFDDEAAAEAYLAAILAEVSVADVSLFDGGFLIAANPNGTAAIAQLREKGLTFDAEAEAELERLLDEAFNGRPQSDDES